MKNEKMADEATKLYREVDRSTLLNDELVLSKMKRPDGSVLYCAYAAQTGKLGFGETQDQALFNLQRTFGVED